MIKFATDITAQVAEAKFNEGVLAALDRSQAVIEFTPKGEILTANENFCAATGYDLSEIQGQHHRIFCDPEYAGSSEYEAFWSDLADGKLNEGE